MTISILNNTSARTASANIGSAMRDIQSSSARLASGQRIINPSDDAAALAIGTGLKTDSSTWSSALTTTTQALAITSIADGGMKSVSDILARLKALASQAINGGMSSNNLSYMKKEMDSLILQIGTVVQTNKFNGIVLLDGTFTNKAFQVGLATTDTITLGFSAVDATSLGVNSIDVTASGGIAAANTALDAAIITVQTYRAQTGADQSRFNFAAANIETTLGNIDAAASIYLDANFAAISTDFANQQTKMQAAIATLANVNNLPQNLLKLIS